MSRTQTIFSKVAACLLLLSAVGLASPRVALIRLNSGQASLDGKTFKTAQMASEGQTLSIDANSEVRIQLLGSSSEVTLAGPLKLDISKSKLTSEAKKVTRGGVAVALDIGNRNTAGSMVTRSSAKAPDAARRKAIRPGLPPESRAGAFFVDYDHEGDLKLAQGAEVYILIQAKNEELDMEIETTFTETLPVLELSPDSIVAGEGYEFTLAAYQDENPVARYNQSFRILTSEQRQFLNEAEKEMVARYNKEKSVLPLLRLASLYQDMDQNREVLKYLEIARRSPHLKENDAELQTRLDKVIGQFKKSIDMTIMVVDA